MLSDRDIAAEMFGNSGGKKLVEPIPEYDETKWAELDATDPAWHGLSSPIQPSSVDLHVGNIFVPKRKTGELGSETHPETSHAVEPGDSVIVSTYETVTLPNHLGGIVFPPSKLSSQGVLVSNIGHIDPGFSGRLRFTVINMGGKPIQLVRGSKDAIGTLLVLPLKTPSKTPWLERGVTVKGEPTREELDALSEDFADMKSRIAKVASEKVRSMLMTYAIGTFAFSVMLGLATIYFSTGQWIVSRLDDNAASISSVKDDLAQSRLAAAHEQASDDVVIARLQADLDAVRARLASLEGSKK